MQFGVCTGIENAGAAADAGFDFVECTVRSLRPEEDDFAPIQARYAAAPLPTPVFNVFVPGHIKLTGPQVEWPTVQDYVERSLARVAAVGGRQVVFGSGGARSVPEGFPRAEAEEQLVRFLRLTGDAAAAHGITIVIEPLNRRESNIINSVPEGVELAQRAAHPNVQVLADLYHMMMDGEPLENVVSCASWLKHVHVADSGRRAPGTGDYPYATFFRLLHQIGYDGLISVECRWEDLATEGPAAATYLREMWEAARSG